MIGSIFAGKLAPSGQDITVLVRGKRAEELRKDGVLLSIPGANKVEITYNLKLNVFSIIPFGVHHIRIVTLDKASWLIETHKNNRTVRFWNHRINLKQLPDGGIDIPKPSR